MIEAPTPDNDYLRLKALYDMNILDTVDEEVYTDIVKLASSICKTPIALISLVDDSRQWFKARVGLTTVETARNISFCGHAIAQEQNFFQVEDTLKDERFIDNPLVVEEPNIRFYAGMPLKSVKGYKIGMLCVIDKKPNVLTDEQIFALKVLSNYAMMLMDVRIMHTAVREMFLEKMVGKK